MKRQPLLPLGWLLLALPAAGQDQFTYTTNNGGITITGYNGDGSVMVIPDTITGLPVTEIGDNAFRFNTTLTCITFPNSVTNIGAGAFNYCTELTAINVETSNPAYSSVSGVLFDKSQTTLLQ
jgi:hypothetical protein